MDCYFDSLNKNEQVILIIWDKPVPYETTMIEPF